MSTLFGILQTGKRSLSAQQFAQNVVGNNVANVNTEGYTRQRAHLKPAHDLRTPWGEVGQGVLGDGIQRYRDTLIDKAFRSSESSFKEWEMKSSYLGRSEAIFTEEGDSGIGSRLDTFFAAWQDLANEPESSQSRQAVREQANSLVTTLNRVGQRLKDERTAANTELTSTVTRINHLLTQIADFNAKSPTEAPARGRQTGELLDRRDLLIDELSTLVDIDVVHQTNTNVNIYIGSLNFVEGPVAQQLTLEATDSSGGITIHNVLTPGGQTLPVAGGELKGLLDVRDEQLLSYQNKLDAIAANLVTEINEYHEQGYTVAGETGYSFFDASFTTAASIRLSTDITSDVNHIAAAAEAAAGDNTQAQRIAALKDARIFEGASLRENYVSLLTSIGTDTRFALDSSDGFSVLKQQTFAHRESVHGVSLDEEMIEMIRYETAYRAASRVITTVDEMIQSVLAMK